MVTIKKYKKALKIALVFILLFLFFLNPFSGDNQIGLSDALMVFVLVIISTYGKRLSPYADVVFIVYCIYLIIRYFIPIIG